MKNHEYALEVLASDNHLLAVNKPAGLLTQGDATGDVTLVDLAKEWIRLDKNKPGNVYCALLHRLDRPASGAVMLARTDKAAGRVSRQFREKSVRKLYRVVVHGSMPDIEGRLCDHLRADKRRKVTRVAASASDKTVEAVLHYAVLRSGKDLTELAVRLETGRKHQIRVQLSHAGCPVVGDFKYGSKQRLFDGRAIALHAEQLTVEHPTLKEPFTVQAPLPAAYWPCPVSQAPKLESGW